MTARPPVLLQTAEELRAFCSAAHIVSPNEAEAISMVRHAMCGGWQRRLINSPYCFVQVGPAPPAELVARFARAGAAVVALRRGPEGAIVHRCAARCMQRRALCGTTDMLVPAATQSGHRRDVGGAYR